MAKRSKNNAESKADEAVKPEEPVDSEAPSQPGLEPETAPARPAAEEEAQNGGEAKRSADAGGADGAVICNNGRQNEVIILGGWRKVLMPREIWRVPSELAAAFEQYIRTPYFQAILASGLFTVANAVTGRMKDPDIASVKTPAPPPGIDPEVPYGNKKTSVSMELES